MKLYNKFGTHLSFRHQVNEIDFNEEIIDFENIEFMSRAFAHEFITQMQNNILINTKNVSQMFITVVNPQPKPIISNKNSNFTVL